MGEGVVLLTVRRARVWSAPRAPSLSAAISIVRPHHRHTWERPDLRRSPGHLQRCWKEQCPPLLLLRLWRWPLAGLPWAPRTSIKQPPAQATKP